MAQLEATAALDELLLQQRALIDSALYSLQENTPLEDLVSRFHLNILALQLQEPSFWQLQVVVFIRSVLKSRVGRCIGDAVAGEQQDPALVVANAITKAQANIELETTLQQLQRDVEMQVAKLKEVLHADEKLLRTTDPERHFLTKFWEKLEETRALQLNAEVERETEQEEQPFESGSFERLSFDEDFNDMSRSAISFPCMEDFPATIRRMQSEDLAERAFGLDELMQIPIVEIIHSGPIFSTACSAVIGLFLDTEIRGERCESAERAKKIIYELVEQVEDATQFAELYWAILDFMGSHLETEELFLLRQDAYESTDQRTIAVLDCFRIFQVILHRVMRHWVYFSAETLAELLHSTFRLLTTYSKNSTEVEAKQMHPLTLLFLVDPHPARWIKLWLLNAPNSRQLFAALEDSGFVADLLQGLSRVRPLSVFKPPNSPMDRIEKRTIQSVLIALSYICEYRQGRELVSKWKRLSAHAYIRQRHTTWKKPELEIAAVENDSLYRTIQVPVSEEKPRDELEINYERLGNEVIDAVVLSVAAIIVTAPKCLQCNDVLYYEQWSTSICNSVAIYLHDAALDKLLAALVKMIEACSADILGEITSMPELEENNPWFPLRQPKGAAKVCQLVTDSISLRVRRGILNASDLRAAGQHILHMVLSSKVVAKLAVKNPSSDTVRLLFELCKRSLQLLKSEVGSSSKQRSCGSSKLLELIADLAVLPQSLKVASESGLTNTLWAVCRSLSQQRDNPEISRLSSCIVSALSRSVEGAHIMHDNPSTHVYQQLRLATPKFRELLGCLSFSASATKFFSLCGVQDILFQLIDELQDSADFTVAVNSPDDEWPELLMPPMRRLQWLRCCLSSQFASSALLSLDRNPLVDFLSKTIAVHKAGFCTSSCQKEDVCCVAFQLILSLVSCVPSMLECSGLLYELKLLDFNDKCPPQRTSLCSGSEILGSCSFLEQQLRYELEVIGGPSEKLPQCELFAFNEARTSYADSTEEKIPSAFAFTLQKKIIQAIKDGTEAGLSTPMDFVLISQASWELVSTLETEFAVDPSVATCKPATAFTAVFAKLIHDLATSKRSRLANSNGLEMNGKPVASSTQNGEAFFPTDSERKLMNRFYKNYARGLSLEPSPTMLHCVIKKFGKVAMDCFPVTVLLLLHPTYDEAEILSFLSLCIASPSAGFLWPKSNGIAGDVVPTAVAIAKGVETILEKEFPQILLVIEQCHCSLLSLVLRWHSQSFWNYFDWENVVLYTYFNVLYGAEFQVYVIVAILRHLEPTMRELTSNHNAQSLAPFLTLIREPIRGFRFSPWRTLLLHLRSEYHEAVETLLFRTVAMQFDEGI